MKRLWVLLPMLLLLVVLIAGCSVDSSGVYGPTSAPGAFPGNAAHPTPNTTSFQGCPPGGDGGDQALNTLKNRTDDGNNGAFQDVSFDTLVNLSYPQDIGRVQRANWSQSDVAAVDKYEGIAVRTTGYVLGVKHEGTESTNCHSTDYRDYHVWLGANASDPRSKSMVIEVTPRERDQRPGWTSSALSSLTGEQVRISGWLLMDQEHPEQLGQTRATLWEIHPIIHIEVNQGGSWQSIDS
ncbi:MAG TPA: hypothetical protein VJR48_19380 [Ktedonobacterales bacterium]|nr:hypothetical protein [Ktedonobacterales bacterium]